jgi:glycine/D-amino acid oxidase-like deaminating enzyme
MDRSNGLVIIIGGGIAGLACARRLHDGGRSFRLITEDIGGRIRTSADGAVNLGAYYVTRDYAHVNQFVDRGRRIRRQPILRGVGDGSFSRSDLPLLVHLPQTLRFSRLIRQFHRHYEIFKRDCQSVSQAQAIRADPLLLELYNEPAPDFIRRHQIEDVARLYLGPYAQGTAFASLNRLSAFTMLVGVLPTIVPIFEYTFRFDDLTAGFEDAIVLDSVIELNHSVDRHLVHTVSGQTLAADNVVVATPIDISTRLLGLGAHKGSIDAHMFLLEGRLRSPWAQASFSLFPEGDETCAIAQQTDGQTLFVSVSEQPDFGRFFDRWEIIEHHHWDPAFHLDGTTLLECEQGPGLYLIGDHNVCTLEDSYITGIYAADRILGVR